MRFIVFAVPVVFFSIAIVLFVGLKRENPNTLPSEMIGRTAPVIELTALGEKPIFKHDDLFKPGLKVVNVFASWCVPCRVEHPNIQAIADLGFPVYGLNYKDQAPAASAFLKELGDPYTAIGQDAGRNAIEWGVYGVPETFILDPDGVILFRHAGPVTAAILEAEILPLLSR